jgi:hypothetical protein
LKSRRSTGRPQISMNTNDGKTQVDIHPFQKGDRVWLDTRHLKTTHHKKIAPRRERPFKITEVIGPVTYRIDLPMTWKVHNVFHATLLQQYKENDMYGANFGWPQEKKCMRLK